MTTDEDEAEPIKEAPREPQFVVPTPYKTAREVVCYRDTFTTHLPLERHTHGLQEAGTTTLGTPSAIVQGTTNPGYLAFVNQELTSDTSNHPFVVFVDPAAQPLPAVASMGFRRDFRDLAKHIILWQPQDGEDE